MCATTIWPFKALKKLKNFILFVHPLYDYVVCLEEAVDRRMCVCVHAYTSGHAYVHAICMWYLWRAEEGVEFFGAGVTEKWAT